MRVMEPYYQQNNRIDETTFIPVIQSGTLQKAGKIEPQ